MQTLGSQEQIRSRNASKHTRKFQLERLDTEQLARAHCWNCSETVHRRQTRGEEDPQIFHGRSVTSLVLPCGRQNEMERSEVVGNAGKTLFKCFGFPLEKIGNAWSWKWNRSANMNKLKMEPNSPPPRSLPTYISVSPPFSFNCSQRQEGPRSGPPAAYMGFHCGPSAPIIWHWASPVTGTVS